jgi:hypothetical protein
MKYNNIIQITLILLFILFSKFCSFSQSNNDIENSKAKNRYVFGFIPSQAKNIFGIAFGPVGSEAICNRPYTKYSHGLNIQIPGQGFFQTFYINKVKFDDWFTAGLSDSLSQAEPPERAVHNGFLLSPLGTFTDRVNGVSFSFWMSRGRKVNGISFNLLWNWYEQINGIAAGMVNHTAQTNGLQIGLVNKSAKLNGFQLGIWNKNEKRSLPFINWNF